MSENLLPCLVILKDFFPPTIFSHRDHKVFMVYLWNIINKIIFILFDLEDTNTED